MVLLLDGNLDICAHVWSDLCYLICLRHLIRSRAVTNWIYFSEKTFFPLCVRLSYYGQYSTFMDITVCPRSSGPFSIVRI